MADAGCAKDDAGDVDEQERSGSGQAEQLDLDGVDRDDQQQQQLGDGGMPHETADDEEGPQAGNDYESDGMQEDDGDDDQEDDIDDRDSDDDEYEEEGYPLVGLADPAAPVPDGHIGLDKLEARFLKGTNDPSKQLSRWIIGRRFTDARQVTDLMRQQGADPDVMTRLVAEGSDPIVFVYPLLAIAIDNKSGYTIRTIAARDDDGCHPIVLPQWSSDELQAAVLTALLDGGADPNAAAHQTDQTPLHLAIASGNQTALDILTARHDIDLRAAGQLYCMVMELPLLPLRQPPPEYLQLLLSMYERLVRRDPTLATEETSGGYNLVHTAATARWDYPQSFIDAYLDLITANGADMTAASDASQGTPLHDAACWGSTQVACYLCRKLPADQINRRNYRDDTPLATAAEELDWYTRELQDPETPEDTKEGCRARCDRHKLTIHSLLRAGADINSLPIDGERQFVLMEYATVLDEVGPAVMSAVNAALAPHRSLAALLTPRLAVGPQEAPIFGWRIASYLFDADAAASATTEAIGECVRHTVMARRVCAAAEHFVKSAVYQTSSNREVVGGTASVGGQVVRVPQLQCFVLEGVDSRPREAVHTRGRVGLREVVHRARMDEAARHGVEGVVKGFNTHLGDADCQFTWQQLGATLQ
ncbi:unnamed protein product [Vitrella brassicaformis CCMP3155]|uniref:Uncharacterized protein n=1 Tax=Vitrella brassicaformis (strain CCMP3155) TaxID=1169540 RepID=A0A0G4FHS4_VITBC|nr:unnamed protein product [Vitrella brassicaformis CCMP3155]|eukprot:CEM12860.1 unnamed protein product [Vitrella brassicaformis CCMP3155]